MKRANLLEQIKHQLLTAAALISAQSDSASKDVTAKERAEHLLEMIERETELNLDDAND
jgi:hypothetical protein